MRSAARSPPLLQNRMSLWLCPKTSTPCPIRWRSTKSPCCATSSTEPKKFRELISELAIMLVYEATRDLPLASGHGGETPLTIDDGRRYGEKIGLIPILPRDLGMVEGAWKLLPQAEVWHLGLYRDERTLEPVQYYNKLPTDPTVQLCLVLIPCWPQVVQPRRRSMCSSAGASTASSFSASLPHPRASQPSTRLIRMWIFTQPSIDERLDQCTRSLSDGLYLAGIGRCRRSAIWDGCGSTTDSAEHSEIAKLTFLRNRQFLAA